MVGLVNPSHLKPANKSQKMSKSPGKDSELEDKSVLNGKADTNNKTKNNSSTINMKAEENNQESLSLIPIDQIKKEDDDYPSEVQNNVSTLTPINRRSSRSNSSNVPEHQVSGPSTKDVVIKKDVVQSDDEDFYGFEMPDTDYNLKNAVVSLSKLVEPKTEPEVTTTPTPEVTATPPPTPTPTPEVTTPSTSRRNTSKYKKSTGLSADLTNPAFKKPFEYGWVRELVYRSISDNTTRRNGDIYYYSPNGKKVRSSRELSDYLHSGLTLDNFTFFKEPLGLNDPNKEIIREAKPKPGMRASLLEDPASSSRKGAAKVKVTPVTPKTPNEKSSSPLKAVTPKIVIRGPTTSKSKTTSTAKSKPPADKKRKSAGPDDVEMKTGAEWSPEQPQVKTNGIKRPLDSPDEGSAPAEKKTKTEVATETDEQVIEEKSDKDSDVDTDSDDDAEIDEDDEDEKDDDKAEEEDVHNEVEHVDENEVESQTPPDDNMKSDEEPKEILSEDSAEFDNELNTCVNSMSFVFQYLRVYELLRASCVNRSWNLTASHNSLWEVVRMKNSKVSDWTGFGRKLALHKTKVLDLRKMLVPDSPEELATMWEQLIKSLEEVKSLVKVDMGRCSPAAFTSMSEAMPQLESLISLAINWKEKQTSPSPGLRKRGNEIDLSPLSKCTLLTELRIKAVSGGLEIKDLSCFKHLTNLKTLGLTTIKNLNGIEDYLPEGLVSLELGECTQLSIDFATKVLPRLTNLRRLRLEKGQNECPTMALLDAISALPSLIQLELINFDIKPGFDKALAKCANLKTLLIIPTYVTQSATTNHVVMGGVTKLSQTLTYFIWGLTLELLKVTDLFIGQVENQKAGRPSHNNPPKKGSGDSIPILKPSTDSEVKDGAPQAPSQVDILALPNLQRVLSTLLPTTKIKILKVPFSATWRQTVTD